MAVYERLGIPTVINGVGYATRLGNCVMHPEVLAAMSEASSAFVRMDELECRAGQIISQLTGAEDGYVLNSAAAGLTMAAAACIAGSDPARINALPDTSRIAHRIVIHRAHRYGYDHAYRAAGAELVEVGYVDLTFPNDIEAAIDERTVAVAFNAAGSENVVPLEKTASIAHAHGLPVIVDAALNLPPVENLRRYVEQGADLVVFSGGKAIGGPPASGFVAGRADLIRAIALQHEDMDVRLPTWPRRQAVSEGLIAGPPHQGLGRAFKVGKEEIVGLIVALQRYVRCDHERESEAWAERARDMAERLDGLSAGIEAGCEGADDPTRVPVVRLHVRPAEAGFGAYDVLSALQEGVPAVFLNEQEAWHDVIRIVPSTLTQAEDEIVVARLAATFAALSGDQMVRRME